MANVRGTDNMEFNSPGNVFKINADTPDMKRPGMEFIWRLECEIAKEEMHVGAAHGSGIARSIVNILDGEVRGPKFTGKVLPGGADWMTVVDGTHVGYASSLSYINHLTVNRA